MEGLFGQIDGPDTIAYVSISAIYPYRPRFYYYFFVAI
jgi:hypothetical protein